MDNIIEIMMNKINAGGVFADLEISQGFGIQISGAGLGLNKKINNLSPMQICKDQFFINAHSGIYFCDYSRHAALSWRVEK